MPFRYTNSLIGTLKQRIVIEAKRRELLDRVFYGRCQGVTVTYTGLCVTQAVAIENEAEFMNSDGTIKTEELSNAIRAAIWDANRQLKAAKLEAVNASVMANDDAIKNPSLARWFEDVNTQRPLAHEAIKVECAPLRIRAIRKDDASLPVAIGDIRWQDTPALSLMEDERFTIREQRRELAVDERGFWRTVELIRKGQVASIPNGVKRQYKEEKEETTDNVTDKVVLNFVQ
jgi:DNA-binding protein YbaB